MKDWKPPPFKSRSFSQEERADVSVRLRRYRREEGNLSYEKLSDRIVEATGWMVHPKSVERIIKDPTRVKDDSIHYCFIFLEAVAPVAIDQRTAEALAGFFEVSKVGQLSLGNLADFDKIRMSVGGLDEQIEQLNLERIAGEYVCFVKAYETRASDQLGAGMPMFIVPDNESGPDNPFCAFEMVEYSRLVFEEMPESNFLRATETVYNPARDIFMRDLPEAPYVSQGILLQCGSFDYLVILRNILDCRFYTLAHSFETDGMLIGSGLETQNKERMLQSVPRPFNPAFEVRLCRPGVSPL